MGDCFGKRTGKEPVYSNGVESSTWNKGKGREGDVVVEVWAWHSSSWRVLRFLFTVSAGVTVSARFVAELR